MLGYYSKLSSEVYDLDKPVGSSFGDVEYYAERLLECDGPVLEPAVGTGRMLIPLLEQGFDVDGFDMSTEMLEICWTNCSERGLDPLVFEASMETFDSERDYGAIIIPTGTFLLMHERESAIQALHNFFKHLLDGGKLIVDVMLPGNIELYRENVRTWTTPKGEVITVESKKVEVDWVKQYSVGQNRYEKWHAGSLVDTELERIPIRWYGIDEFKDLLEKVGFTDITVSADYEYGKTPSRPGQTVTFEAVANKSGGEHAGEKLIHQEDED